MGTISPHAAVCVLLAAGISAAVQLKSFTDMEMLVENARRDHFPFVRSVNWDSQRAKWTMPNMPGEVVEEVEGYFKVKLPKLLKNTNPSFYTLFTLWRKCPGTPYYKCSVNSYTDAYIVIADRNGKINFLYQVHSTLYSYNRTLFKHHNKSSESTWSTGESFRKSRFSYLNVTEKNFHPNLDTSTHKSVFLLRPWTARWVNSSTISTSNDVQLNLINFRDDIVSPTTIRSDPHEAIYNPKSASWIVIQKFKKTGRHRLNCRWMGRRMRVDSWSPKETSPDCTLTFHRVVEVKQGDGMVIRKLFVSGSLPRMKSGMLPQVNVLPNVSPFDQFHLNSIHYDEEGGAYYLNMYHFYTFYKLQDRGKDTPVIEWGAGADSHLAFFDVNQQEYRMPIFQAHDVEPLGNDRFILFDNVSPNVGEERSRVLIIRVNPAKKRVDVEWSYQTYFQMALGDADVLPNGNVLITAGYGPCRLSLITTGCARPAVISEVTYSQQLVWELRVTNTEESDWAIYRSERFYSRPMIEPMVQTIEVKRGECIISINATNSISEIYPTRFTLYMFSNMGVIVYTSRHKFLPSFRPTPVSFLYDTQFLEVGSHLFLLQLVNEDGLTREALVLLHVR